MLINQSIAISKEIEKRVHAFQSLVKIYPTSLNSTLWCEFGRKMADGGLRNWQVTNEHIGFLFLSQKNIPEILKETVLVSKKLIGKPVGAFTNLSEVSRSNLDIELKEGIINGMLKLFLLEINIRLQTLYKLYLSIFNSIQDKSHNEIISNLATNLEKTVYEFLRACDLPYMLEWLGFQGDGEELDKVLLSLSNYFFRLDKVNFRFTYHCNISCRHCYNSSGPNLKNMRITLERMQHIIEQMPAIGIRKLNITGGEPFLYLADILKLVQYARSHGITQISILTNASWATTHKRTFEILSLLMDAGFGIKDDYIKASAGIYHQEFVPIERVFILGEVYYTVFKRCLVVDYERDAEGIEEEKMIKLLSEKGLTQKVRINFRDIAPLGRGRLFSGKRKSEFSNSPCLGINQIVFDPNGMVRPCCGLNAENIGVVVGKNDDLRILIKSIQNNPILQYIASHPIENIFQYTGNTAQIYTTKCEACQKAIGELKDTEHLKRCLTPLQEYYPFWFSKELLRYLG